MKHAHHAFAQALRTDLARSQESSPTLRAQHRLHAVLLVCLGRSGAEVGGWFGHDARSVARWVYAYQRDGLEGLADHRKTGRAARLSAQQMGQLSEELRQSPRLAGYAHAQWSGKLLAVHLERHYGVALGLRQCQRLLQLDQWQHQPPDQPPDLSLGARTGLPPDSKTSPPPDALADLR